MKFYDICGGLSFLAALGIVGSVENGAPLGLMALAFVFVGIMGICIIAGERV